MHSAGDVAARTASPLLLPPPIPSPSPGVAASSAMAAGLKLSSPPLSRTAALLPVSSALPSHPSDARRHPSHSARPPPLHLSITGLVSVSLQATHGYRPHPSSLHGCRSAINAAPTSSPSSSDLSSPPPPPSLHQSRPPISPSTSRPSSPFHLPVVASPMPSAMAAAAQIPSSPMDATSQGHLFLFSTSSFPLLPTMNIISPIAGYPPPSPSSAHCSEPQAIRPLHLLLLNRPPLLLSHMLSTMSSFHLPPVTILARPALQ